MSDRWWKHRKKRRRNPWFGDVFDEFDRIEHMMDEMMRQAFKSPSSERRDKRSTKRGPHVYGFSMTTGPNGKPIIEEYGNIIQNHPPPKVQIREAEEEAEPLIDILELPKTITILAQLPGAKQGDINLDFTETQATITAETDEQSYHKTLQLPALVIPESAETLYKNGVLQIKLKKIPLAKTSFE